MDERVLGRIVAAFRFVHGYNRRQTGRQRLINRSVVVGNSGVVGRLWQQRVIFIIRFVGRRLIVTNRVCERCRQRYCVG